MPSHWFILIGFGFSQQQSELIFLSWNNSAPFVPLFYCLIPFILFYCQSFVSLGLQVISNPVGCYNKAFITQLPWFPCPFWSGARTCCLTWDFNPFGAPAASPPLCVEAASVQCEPGSRCGLEGPPDELTNPNDCVWSLIDTLMWLGSRYTLWPNYRNRILSKNLLTEIL